MVSLPELPVREDRGEDLDAALSNTATAAREGIAWT